MNPPDPKTKTSPPEIDELSRGFAKLAEGFGRVSHDLPEMPPLPYRAPPKEREGQVGKPVLEECLAAIEKDKTNFRLTNVAGRRSRMSNAEFERACLVHIGRLQDGLGPYDSAMMDTFCEAVRMVREYSDAMTPLKDLSP